MGVGETLRSYVSQDWELYNEIGGGNEKIAASTFRMGLPENSKLRESLTKRHPEDMRQLMRCTKEYKRLEDDRLMCKVFPLSLGSTALRWFNGLRKGSIRSFAELIQEFGARFVTCSRVPQPVDALLSIKIGVGETLRSYASHYLELYNEIDGGNEKITASTFRMGLLENSELWELLTKRPLEDMRQLMRRIEEYKRLEDDRSEERRVGKECA